MEKRLGKADDFFAKVNVIALKLEDEIQVGDTIHIKGNTTDFTENVSSLQIEHKPVDKAKPGDSIGIKVNGYAKRGDIVYKVIPE